MNFMGLSKRADKAEKAFEELQIDLADAIEESLEHEDLPPPEDGVGPEENLAATDDGSRPQDNAGTREASLRLTSHAQSRLAALSSFDQLVRDSQGHFDEINAKLSEIAASHHLTRGFFNILNADILRANELEQANIDLTMEHRVLSEQLQHAIRKQYERQSVVETLQQREAALVQSNEALRDALAAARLQLVEAANTSARKEAEFGDLAKALSVRTVEAERRARANELLREKHVSLSIDLDTALKREVEAHHRLDELSAIHTKEAARHSELLDALGKSEKEAMRLQKSLESTQAKLSDMTESAHIMGADREAEIARSLAEIRGLRSEIQNLQSQLELASTENSQASDEIATLKAQWSDAQVERKVADERLAALLKESENDRQRLSAVTADFSQLSVQQASEQIQLDIQRQECEDLRAEVASLNARIKELLPYERLHRVTNARQRESGVVEPVGVVVEPARAKSRRRVRPGLRAVS